MRFSFFPCPTASFPLSLEPLWALTYSTDNILKGKEEIERKCIEREAKREWKGIFAISSAAR